LPICFYDFPVGVRRCKRLMLNFVLSATQLSRCKFCKMSLDNKLDCLVKSWDVVHVCLHCIC